MIGQLKHKNNIIDIIKAAKTKADAHKGVRDYVEENELQLGTFIKMLRNMYNPPKGQSVIAYVFSNKI